MEENCRSHGINYYVSKPFEPETFIHTILEVLKGKPCLGSSFSQPADTREPLETTAPAEPSPAAGAPLPAGAAEGPAMDSARAIRDLGIDESLYTAILQEYFKENESTGQALQKLVDAGDFAQAALAVHKVKSSSGSIGAKQLAQCASKLQKALQENEPEAVRAEHARFQTLLQKTMEEIRAWLSSSGN